MTENDFSDLPPELRPTAVDLEMGEEAVLGHPITPASLAAGIATMQARITQFETQRDKIIAHAKAGRIKQQSADEVVPRIAAEITTARQRLADYQRQADQQN